MPFGTRRFKRKADVVWCKFQQVDLLSSSMNEIPSEVQRNGMCVAWRLKKQLEKKFKPRTHRLSVGTNLPSDFHNLVEICGYAREHAECHHVGLGSNSRHPYWISWITKHSEHHKDEISCCWGGKKHSSQMPWDGYLLWSSCIGPGFCFSDFPAALSRGAKQVKRLGGYSALRIARNLPEGGKLLSVEKDSLWVISHWVYLSLLPRSSGCKDELFAAIATKIIEFAGLDDKASSRLGPASCKTKPPGHAVSTRRWRFGWEQCTLRLPTLPTGSLSNVGSFSLSVRAMPKMSVGYSSLMMCPGWNRNLLTLF